MAAPIVQIHEVESMFTQHLHAIIRGLGPRLARPLVAGALCAALVAATPATASAESVDDADRIGDVMRMALEDSPRPVPERTLNDISNTKLTHRHRGVRIRVDYVDLKRKARQVSQHRIDGHQRGGSSRDMADCSGGTPVRRTQHVHRGRHRARTDGLRSATLDRLSSKRHEGEFSAAMCQLPPLDAVHGCR